MPGRVQFEPPPCIIPWGSHLVHECSERGCPLRQQTKITWNLKRRPKKFPLRLLFPVNILVIPKSHMGVIIFYIPQIRNLVPSKKKTRQTPHVSRSFWCRIRPHPAKKTAHAFSLGPFEAEALTVRPSEKMGGSSV